MRINYYRFPGTMSDEERFNAYFDTLMEMPNADIEDLEWRRQRSINLGEVAPFELQAISITLAKKFLKKYGGVAFTQHFDRDGGLFETTEIKLKGNNSKHKYNRHL